MFHSLQVLLSERVIVCYAEGKKRKMASMTADIIGIDNTKIDIFPASSIFEATDDNPASFVIFAASSVIRSEEHTSELQSRFDLVCRLLLEKKNIKSINTH